MSKLAFFSIPAHGHTNPTIEVVRALVTRGNKVRYYSFETFRDRIEATGAQFIPCDDYMPPMPKNMERRVRNDFASLIEMATHVTLAMGEATYRDLKEFQPDIIVADSMCIWGKLYAKRLNVPMICSTTSFAFNQHTAKLMKGGFSELFHSLTGIPRMNKCVKRLRENGYEVGSIVELIQNDNDTDTIVYTSREFQPQANTFSEKYAFVGPSLGEVEAKSEPHHRERPQIYISMGTILHDMGFCQNCIEALCDCPYEVVMAVGEEKNVAALQNVPANFQVEAYVKQLEVLQNTDVFITHAGMNSVNESIYYEVPMVLVPQHSEQGAVAQRAQEVGAGIILKSSKPAGIREAIEQILSNKQQYNQNIRVIADSFRNAGGAERAAGKIEAVIAEHTKS